MTLRELLSDGLEVRVGAGEEDPADSDLVLAVSDRLTGLCFQCIGGRCRAPRHEGYVRMTDHSPCRSCPVLPDTALQRLAGLAAG